MLMDIHSKHRLNIKILFYFQMLNIVYSKQCGSCKYKSHRQDNINVDSDDIDIKDDINIKDDENYNKIDDNVNDIKNDLSTKINNKKEKINNINLKNDNILKNNNNSNKNNENNENNKNNEILIKKDINKEEKKEKEKEEECYEEEDDDDLKNEDINFKDISKIKNAKEFKEYLNSFFINSTFNVDDSDLKKFFKHYNSNEFFLDKKLHYILLEIFKQEVDNDKLLKLIKYKLKYDENKKNIKYNKNVFLKTKNTTDSYNKIICFTDKKNEKKYFRKYTDTNIKDENLLKETAIILADITRTGIFKYNNINLSTSPIYDDFKNSLTKVLVNLSLYKGNDNSFYFQGMNYLARFFLFLCKNNNSKDKNFNSKLAYKLNYLFYDYKFNEKMILPLFYTYNEKGKAIDKNKNKKGFSVLDCYNNCTNIGNISNYLEEIIFQYLKIKKEEKNIYENNVVSFISKFTLDIGISINDYNKLKNLFLLLFILDRYNVIFDIFLIYLSKKINNEFEEDENSINKFSIIFE